MPVSTRARERARAFLPPGARIDYMFPAMPMHGRWSPLGLGQALVAVTDTEIVVLGLSLYRRDRPVTVIGRFPRATALGPATEPGPVSEPGATITVGNLVLSVESEYVSVINAADAEIGAAEMPPDPLPDL